MEKLLFTVDEVLDLIPISNTGLYKAIANGDIESLKHGRRRYFTGPALISYVAKLSSPKRQKRSEVSHGY